LAQIFPKWTLRIPLYVALGVPLFATAAVGGVWYWGSPRFTDVGYRPRQPVQYNHQLHAGTLGIDCRYCHAAVESAAMASVPPTATCMNCHHVIRRDSPLVQPVRESLEQGRPLRWVRVHNLPDYAYFHHAAHVNAGVACVSCHGRIDQMPVVTQAEPLSMGWCLECHRDPASRLRPSDAVTEMEWFPPRDHAEWAAQRIESQGIAPPQDCSGCHR
jgi:hypothetical protein